MILASHRLLLRLYPRAFREAFAEEMAAVFAEALAEAAGGGRGAAARLVARELGQAPLRVLEAHWQNWHEGAEAGTGSGEAEMIFRRPIQWYAGIALILLAIAIVGVPLLGIGLGLVSTLLPVMLAGILILGGLAGALAPVLRRLGAGAWLGAGLVCLVGLAWPTSALVEDGWNRLPPVASTIRFALPPVAIVVAAVLLAAGLAARCRRKGTRRPGRCRAF